MWDERVYGSVDALHFVIVELISFFLFLQRDALRFSDGAVGNAGLEELRAFFLYVGGPFVLCCIV